MYKVFIDNIPIIFTDSKDLEENTDYYSAELLKDLNRDLPILLEKMEPGKELIVGCLDAKKEFKRLFGSYELIEAAGGIVSCDNHVLCIYRNGCWDLPKGKIEKKESIQLAAVREIEEECGVTGLKVIDEVCTTYHTYTFKSKNVLKKTYWFSVTIQTMQSLTPQIEEGITEAKWIDIAAVEHLFSNTYLSIQEVWRNFIELANGR